MRLPDNNDVSRIAVLRELLQRSRERSRRLFIEYLPVLVYLLGIVAFGTIVIYFLSTFGEAGAQLGASYVYAIADVLTAGYSWLFANDYVRLTAIVLGVLINLYLWYAFVFRPLHRWLESKWDAARNAVQEDTND